MISRLLAGGAWLLTAAFNVLMLWTLVTTNFLRAVGDPTVTVTGEMLALVWIAMTAIAAVTLCYTTVGLLLASRPRSRRIGIVLLTGGLAFAAIPLGYVVGGWMVMLDPADPVANLLFLVGPTSIAAGYALILPVLALLFPQGSLPSARWRLPSLLAGGLLVAATLIAALRPGEIAGTASRNPFGIESMPASIGDAGDLLAGIGVILVSVLGVAAVVTRYRHGGEIERHQLRWFVAAVLLAAFPFAMSPQPGIGGPAWLVLAAVGLLLVPVSVWIAVTRHRLYEIDRIISRTIAYAVVTVLLGATFAATILVSQTLLAPFTQGETIAVAASTLAAFALFQPVMRRVRRAVDRRFDRSRYDAERTAAAFAERLRNEVDLATVAADLRSVVTQTVAPATLGTWFRDEGPVTDRPGSPIP